MTTFLEYLLAVFGLAPDPRDQHREVFLNRIRAIEEEYLRSMKSFELEEALGTHEYTAHGLRRVPDSERLQRLREWQEKWGKHE